jgi:VCBS repeat-containing protein
MNGANTTVTIKAAETGSVPKPASVQFDVTGITSANNGTMQISANDSAAVNTLFKANSLSSTNAIKFIDGTNTQVTVTAASGSSPATVKYDFTGTIPTVHNKKLTLNVGGETVANNNTFTANASQDKVYNVPIMTNSAYGVAKAYYGKLTSNRKVQDQTTLTNRYYGVQTTIDGKLVVNVPWTNINDDYVDIQQFESLDMVGRSETTGYMIALGDVNQSINEIVYIPPMSASGYGVAKVGSGNGKVNIDTSGQLTYGHINKGTGTIITGSSVANASDPDSRQNIITNIYAETDDYGHIVSMSYDYLYTHFDLSNLANLSGNVVSYTPGTNYINNIEVATSPGTNLNTLYIIL